MKKDKILSIHIPRTGGGTFYNLLISYSRLIENPKFVMEGPNRHYRNGGKVNMGEYNIIHGHFFYEQCNHLDIPKMTWLRHPVDRVISRYYYPTGPIPSKSIKGLIEWVSNQKDTLPQADRMTKQIHSLKHYDLILRTERYDESLKLFAEWSGIVFPDTWNPNDDRNKKYGFRRNTCKRENIPEDVWKQLEQILAPDMKLYNDFLKICHKSLL